MDEAEAVLEWVKQISKQANKQIDDKGRLVR